MVRAYLRRMAATRKMASIPAGVLRTTHPTWSAHQPVSMRPAHGQHTASTRSAHGQHGTLVGTQYAIHTTLAGMSSMVMKNPAKMNKMPIITSRTTVQKQWRGSFLCFVNLITTMPSRHCGDQPHTVDFILIAQKGAEM